MLIAIGALRDQSPDEGFVHRAVPFRRPDHLLHNHAVPVDHPALGHARRLVGPLDGAGLIVQDESGAIQRSYQTTGVPESWVIDRHGVIVKKVIGPSEWDGPVNEALIRRLIAERPDGD